jgi:small subunit ribosomal protein S13
MLYIFNKTISDSNNILYALTILYGININQSATICNHVGINPLIPLKKLKTYHVNKLIKYINQNIKVEQLLRKEKKDKLKELLDIKINRSIRFSQGLPVRSQRTHTNAKTVKKFKTISTSKK